MLRVCRENVLMILKADICWGIIQVSAVVILVLDQDEEQNDQLDTICLP